jgi:acyl-CoA synthetase (NDP forming)
MSSQKISLILSNVQKDGRTVLLEHEVYEIFRSINIKTPSFVFVPFDKDLASCIKDSKSIFSSDEVVVKVVSEEILHKTELGGVIFCKNNDKEIRAAIDKIKKNTKSYKVSGFLVVEKVSYKTAFGHELIVSVRNTADFGTILGFGLGGLDTEFFGKHMSTSFSVIASDDLSLASIKKNAAYYKLSGMDRTKKRLVSDESILDLLKKLAELGKENKIISECEINPIVVSNGELIAIDGLMKIGKTANKVLPAPRPTQKLEALLHPKSIAVIGVSEKGMNMGRIILNNIIKRGFSKKDIYVIKPDTKEIDGVVCVSSIKALPAKVDLLVLAVSAGMAGAVIEELVLTDKAQSVIVIPGGFAEKEGGEKLEEGIIELIQKSRKSKDAGPIIVGGNCLGVISNPGNYDTFFIPSNKMIYSTPKPYAFISQSGAFVISKLSKTDLTPQYAVSIGNQMDLTVSDYLEFFKGRDEIKLLALYVEGFKPSDGLKTAQSIRELKKQGKDIIIYKGGRSSLGKSAASGHTASIAGEYSVYKSIMTEAGAFVVDNFCDFEDALKIFLHFDNFKISFKSLAVISNAGFETVGMADNIKDLNVPMLSKTSQDKIREILSSAKIDSLVAVGNPLDVTPVANDKIYIDCFKVMLDDDAVSCGILSCVPMSPAIKTIEEELGPESMFNMVQDYSLSAKKPFLVVVDSGELFDPACRVLKNIPVFRESDRAVAALSRYLNYKLTELV